MSIIRTNQPNFFGKSGEPVKNGFVYIGQPNQDPEDFPKTVTFTDAAGGSFTAQQPLRTNSAGQISYNGKAIIASVTGDYSMRVLDSNSVEVAWIPEVEGDTNGGVDLSDYRRYAPLLADVKQIDVSIGETVGSFGKTSLTDGNGADWIVVANTGAPANDVTLIDFDNGLQGVNKQVGTDNIKDSSVTNDKIPAGELGAEKFQSGSAEDAWVGLRYSDITAVDVGIIVLAAWVGDAQLPFELGDEISGSILRAASIDPNQISSVPLPGTWRCLGLAVASTAESRITLWQRVS